MDTGVRLKVSLYCSNPDYQTCTECLSFIFKKKKRQIFLALVFDFFKFFWINFFGPVWRQCREWVRAFIVKGARWLSPLPSGAGRFDAAEAGECEALTGRCGRAEPGEVCLQQQQQQQQGYNPGLPAHWGERVSWLRLFHPNPFIPYFSVIPSPLYIVGAIATDFMSSACTLSIDCV